MSSFAENLGFNYAGCPGSDFQCCSIVYMYTKPQGKCEGNKCCCFTSMLDRTLATCSWNCIDVMASGLTNLTFLSVELGLLDSSNPFYNKQMSQ